MSQYDINLREYWRVLKKRKWTVLVTAIIMGIFSIAVAIVKAPPPLYASVCSIKFEKETLIEGLYAKTISWSSGDNIQTQVSVIKSYAIFQKVAEKLGLISPSESNVSPAVPARLIGIVEELQGKITVNREAFTNIINIEAKDASPLFAQRLAETIAKTYQEIHSAEQLKETTDAIHYIQEQLKTVRQQLKDAEDEFSHFTQVNQIVSIQAQSENLLTDAQQIQNEIRKLAGDREELARILVTLEPFSKKPFDGTNNFYSAKASHEYQLANNTLLELLVQHNTLLQDYTSQHPEVVTNTRKIIETANKMIILLRLQIDSLNRKEVELKNDLANNELKTKNLMDKKIEFDRQKRMVDLYSDMTNLLERKNQEAKIREAEKPQEVMIVKPALIPNAPVNPPKTVSTGLLGMLIGIVLGMVAAFIVETFDTSLGAIEEVEESIGAPVLGVIPETDLQQVVQQGKEKYPEAIKSSAFLQSAHLVSHFSPKSMIAESFRALRTNLQFKDNQEKIKTLAITSASPQEGKTVISINLAIAMAQAGLKTLLVGSDMRKPMLAKVFGIEEAPGLTDILLGNFPWRDTVKTVTDIIMGKMTLEEVMYTPGLDNLHIITGGTIPPNPAELLESKSLLDFIVEVKKEYDLIIFDSPPIVSTADAVIMGSKADRVLMVYRLGRISKNLLKRAASQLGQVNCKIMGVVLNGMKPEISPDFQDVKYYKYYYSYGHEDVKHHLKKDPAGSPFSQKNLKAFWNTKNLGAIFKSKLFLKWLIIIAGICLAAGILWKNGIYYFYSFFGS